MIRKPNCNFYNHCLTGAALTDAKGFDCLGCERYVRSDEPATDDFAPYLKLLARIFPTSPAVLATRDDTARSGGFIWT